MTRHVGIRVAEDLGDYINWHPEAEKYFLILRF